VRIQRMMTRIRVNLKVSARGACLPVGRPALLWRGSSFGGQLSIFNFQTIFNFKIFKHLISCHCEERSDEAISYLILSLRVPMLRHEAISYLILSLRAPPKHRGTKQSLIFSLHYCSISKI